MMESSRRIRTTIPSPEEIQSEIPKKPNIRLPNHVLFVPNLTKGYGYYMSKIPIENPYDLYLAVEVCTIPHYYVVSETRLHVIENKCS